MITLRDAYRSLRATPLVSAVAIASLMLGIGGNTAMFSILNSLVLKPLPVHEPRELVAIDSAVSNEWFALSYQVWTEIRNRRLAVTLRPVAEQLRVFDIRERLLALLAVFFATLALLIAGIGLYGVTACAVARRRREIGIRIALGADRRRIVGLVLGRVLWLSAAGAAAGMLGGLWAARLVQSLLFGMEARDPLTFIAAALVLLAVAGLAGWLPARRASRIDPADALRH